MRGSISDPEEAIKGFICSGRAGVLTVGETIKPESGAFAFDGPNSRADRVCRPVRASCSVRFCIAPSLVSRLCAIADSTAWPVPASAGSSSDTFPAFCTRGITVSATVRRAGVKDPAFSLRGSSSPAKPAHLDLAASSENSRGQLGEQQLESATARAPNPQARGSAAVAINPLASSAPPQDCLPGLLPWEVSALQADRWPPG